MGSTRSNTPEHEPDPPPPPDSRGERTETPPPPQSNPPGKAASPGQKPKPQPESPDNTKPKPPLLTGRAAMLIDRIENWKGVVEYFNDLSESKHRALGTETWNNLEVRPDFKGVRNVTLSAKPDIFNPLEYYNWNIGTGYLCGPYETEDSYKHDWHDDPKTISLFS